MDLDKAIRLSRQRTEQLVKQVNPSDTKEKEDPRTLPERFQSIIQSATECVDRDNPIELEPIAEMRSPTINVTRAEGALPNIGLRISIFVLKDQTVKDQYGYSFTNQFGEIITGVIVEWVHTPPLVVGNPLQKAISSAESLIFGEVFATEAVNDPLQRRNLIATPNSFKVVEESLDVYKAANRSAELT
jgi:hypothetical protein